MSVTQMIVEKAPWPTVSQSKQIVLNVFNSFVDEGLDSFEACKEASKRCGVSVPSIKSMLKEQIFTGKLLSNSPKRKKDDIFDKLTLAQINLIRGIVSF